MRSVAFVLVSFVFCVFGPGIVATSAAEDVAACLERNTPEPDSVRALRIVARDRVGHRRVTRVRMFGSRDPEARRQLRLEFLEPADVKGTSILMLERADGNEIYLRTGETDPVKRIRGAGRAATLFGSDFTYEDFEYMLGFDGTKDVKRIDDAMVAERPVFVVKLRPGPDSNSAYESVIISIDKERCVALRMELFEAGGRLRKILHVDESQVMDRGGVWIAHLVTLRDIRDYSTTQVFVDSTEQETLSGDMFSLEGFERRQAPSVSSP